eukprot:comp18977_c0_seq1/m.21283 comp18977_c0_seq1/g.21283  ORF comp18977_c0_seq1/g.21283 comp18977_c0_seq1/m.21283 type:complete len:553 (-) comp18977_c0_seq1:256-1914(-)
MGLGRLKRTSSYVPTKNPQYAVVAIALLSMFLLTKVFVGGSNWSVTSSPSAAFFGTNPLDEALVNGTEHDMEDDHLDLTNLTGVDYVKPHEVNPEHDDDEGGVYTFKIEEHVMTQDGSGLSSASVAPLNTGSAFVEPVETGVSESQMTETPTSSVTESSREQETHTVSSVDSVSTTEIPTESSRVPTKIEESTSVVAQTLVHTVMTPSTSNETSDSHVLDHERKPLECSKRTESGPLLFTTYVSGWQYVSYMPLYAFSALTSYPDAFVAFYTGQNVPKDVIEQLRKLRSDRWCIEQNYKVPLLQRGGHPAYMRNFILNDFSLDFTYTYLGDVDLLVVPEKPTLVEAHVEHMHKMGLVYSNVDRYVLGARDRFEPRKRCTKPDCHRLTGLHFVETRPYVEATRNATQEMEGWLLQMGGKDVCEKKLSVRFMPFCDEVMLYQIVKRSGLGLPERKEDWYRPHHGLHLSMYLKRKTEETTYVRKIIEMFGNDKDQATTLAFYQGVKGGNVGNSIGAMYAAEGRKAEWKEPVRDLKRRAMVYLKAQRLVRRRDVDG